MRKTTVLWLIIAASLIFVGLGMFAAVMAVNHWDFTKLSTVKFETNTYSISTEFTNISAKTDTADVIILPSHDGICKVVCYEQENEKHSVAIQDGTLTINVLNEKEWYTYIGISTGTPKITVYLPDTEYSALSIAGSTGYIEIPKEILFERIDVLTSTGDVNTCASASEAISIKTGTGDIRVENVSADRIDLSVSTGKISAQSILCKGEIQINVSTGDAKLSDVTSKNITSTGNTGDILLENVIAAEAMSITRSTGDVTLVDCDGAKLLIQTDTGDVQGSLLSEKVFFVETDTGSVQIPKTTTGGTCEITTTTGDIQIDIRYK